MIKRFIMADGSDIPISEIHSDLLPLVERAFNAGLIQAIDENGMTLREPFSARISSADDPPADPPADDPPPDPPLNIPGHRQSSQPAEELAAEKPAEESAEQPEPPEPAENPGKDTGSGKPD